MKSARNRTRTRTRGRISISISILSWILVVVLVAFALTLEFALALARSCDPLLLAQREGLRIQCSNASGGRISCNDRHGLGLGVGIGTVARYACQLPYYYGPDGRGRGPEPKTKLSDTVTCEPGGKWSPEGLARFQPYNCTLNCGLSNFGTLTSHIIQGSVAGQAAWPWHASIFKRGSRNRNADADADFNYACGGTLIKPDGSSEFLIVTAAHCVSTTRNRPAPFDNLRIVLGTNELPSSLEHPGQAQVLHVREIVLHESYDGGASVYQSDIAVVRLMESVQLSLNVLPACFSASVARPAVGHTGHIAGFGVTDPLSPFHSTELRSASFPIVYPDKCSEWRTTRRLDVQQEFCAGTDTQDADTNANGQNACLGDSGGGMVFNASDGRFYLQGIVSHGRGVLNGKPGVCDTYTVFTKVSAYVEWVYEVVEKFNEKHGQNLAGATTEKVASTATVTAKPTSSKFLPLNQRNCGLSPQSASVSSDKIVSKRSDWPWHASIFIRKGAGFADKDYMYTCDGSLLLSSSTVAVILTAASCVTHANSSVRSVRDFKIVIGMLEPLLERLAVHSPEAQVFSVRKIVVHESFAEQESFYDHDIALMILEAVSAMAMATISVPVCLPTAIPTDSSRTATTLLPTPGDVGHVASFRASGREQSLRLTLNQFPVVYPDNCGRGDSVVTHERQFCAGNASVPCYGRRGAGLTFTRAEQGNEGHITRFYVEGIASRGRSGLLNALNCRHGVYTRVAAYVHWIQEVTTDLFK